MNLWSAWHRWWSNLRWRLAGEGSDRRALIQAMLEADVAAVRHCLAMGVSPERQELDESAWPPMWPHLASWAVAQGDVGLLHAALSAPVSQDVLDGALRMASSQGQVSCAEMLLAAGADAEALDETGASALDIAVSAGHLDTVVALLAANALPYPQREREPSSSPAAGSDVRVPTLHRARTIALIDRLLAAGADPYALDGQQRSWMQALLGSPGSASPKLALLQHAHRRGMPWDWASARGLPVLQELLARLHEWEAREHLGDAVRLVEGLLRAGAPASVRDLHTAMGNTTPPYLPPPHLVHVLLDAIGLDGLDVPDAHGQTVEQRLESVGDDSAAERDALLAMCRGVRMQAALSLALDRSSARPRL